MKDIKTICDVCKSEMTKITEDAWRSIEVKKCGKTIKEWDYCPSCYVELTVFMTQEPNFDPIIKSAMEL